MQNAIGIDVGTSAVKAVLVDEKQRILAAASENLVTQHPHDLWSEQDPRDWWTAVERALDALARSAAGSLRDVRALGLSGQMHGLVALDAADVPIRPAILWNDGRAFREARELLSVGMDLIRRLGAVPSAGYLAPKLLWLRAHEPAVLERTRRLLLPKDYVGLQLTGEKATDASDGSGTWLLDATTRNWSAEAVRACGIDIGLLPSVHEGTDAIGRLSQRHCRRWNMPEDVVVAAGGGDAACGGVGLGAVERGRAYVNLGTSGQMFIAMDRHEPAPEHVIQAFCHAVPDAWYKVAALLNGASPLAFMAGLLGSADVGALLAEAEARFREPSSLLVLPYLAGERTPHNDALARGAVFGLSSASTRSDVVQATLEGVAFSLADALEALGGKAAGIDRLGFIGGGARSRLWARIIASVLGIPLERYEGTEHAAALGAARLAFVASGMPLAEAAARPALVDVIEPEADLAQAYPPRLEAFRQLYRQTKSIGRA